MPVQSFSFPLPETRFFRAGRHVYKFKIKSGSKCSDEIINDEHTTQELEDVVRVVLANLDSLQPFVTKHFNIFPYKSRWERVSELQFQQGGLMLTAYPFLLTLYLETHDGLHAHTAKQSGAWTPVRAAEQGALPLPRSLTCQHKRSRTEQPPGGSPTQHRRGGARPPPERTTGAETMAGDRRVCLPAERRPAVSTHHAPTALRPVTAAHDHRLTHGRTQVPGHLAAVNTAPVSSAVIQTEGWEEGGAESEGEGLTRTAEQGEPEGPAPSDSETGQPGVLTSFARKLFPFSLFVRSWRK
ncbi:uncharacterized protein LOC118224011 isoform X2 [Anguilla anguilla]|uniref:Membrane-anchored junction protein n=2 Tax=Anguilla anguilla TaxID=7936 RepID=A0A9D3MQ89_ANGAN|nr:uncharacterized protein LOC118224011 isoform X2 [Anguilla anguilla]XP_035267049.1 uncharacterized protein LOC118224011 isoform X2 [Anguilla anguilla]XP_035267050.1 uncharacterized protein LOC118224011 isoform X2 [Anguilla anguilla]KAG5851932.1 hypothetical protein ANANG_G00057090 [Anguilla anguilla]